MHSVQQSISLGKAFLCFLWFVADKIDKVGSTDIMYLESVWFLIPGLPPHSPYSWHLSCSSGNGSMTELSYFLLVLFNPPLTQQPECYFLKDVASSVLGTESKLPVSAYWELAWSIPFFPFQPQHAIPPSHMHLLLFFKNSKLAFCLWSSLSFSPFLLAGFSFIKW